MSTLATALRALQRDRRRLLQVATPAAVLCIVAGVLLLLLLPLKEYSRQTYISENALLPGQVHTYFDGSEHNIFRAYRHEVHGLVGKPGPERYQRLSEILRSSGLKVATQKYNYATSATNATGENVYAVLHGPRADATEAIVLIGAWKNMDNIENQSGVALVLTLARYFKRWSLWSKDIIFIISEDSVAGPQAWVDAYHDAHDPNFVQPLTIKSGALQGAIAIDYPAGPWGHRFDKLQIIYDGINGMLPNLDLFNTAVSVASGQMGIGCTLQRMLHHSDSYKERLTTLTRGMVNQALGHSTGPHSGFMRYHVDAITLQTVGDGWHDEMSLGRTVEGIFRSLNNLLEHLHQSFFFYLLMQSNSFVSIGTYLPSAMCIAAAFNIMAIALWFQTGFRNTTSTTTPSEKPSSSEKPPSTAVIIPQPSSPSTTASQTPVERHLFLPLLLLTAHHFLGLLPLTLLNTLPSATTFTLFALLSLPLPAILARLTRPTEQELSLLACFTHLQLGMTLAALATVNYSLAYGIGLLCVPILLVRLPTHLSLRSASQVSSRHAGAGGKAARVRSVVLGLVLLAVNPCSLIWAGATLVPGGLGAVLAEAAFGWQVYGLWTQVIVWLVWWPAWSVAAYVLVAQGIL
ncbi:Glycosylphosphatidylinositol:protein transamidase, GAA1 component [Microthyrium microscopicum]|uniref:Glycosylphosphatidylinositol:protein transamidase, GAA1 component n=1 Tax=Microthyrium microscopicum TaxID=703497 RepID=A0A6A6TXV4_9PEZI|nr:Glycosylphosphatidylinositol:protein transamidase, GAA1 component [Microthyrium microscopicum]